MVFADTDGGGGKAKKGSVSRAMSLLVQLDLLGGAQALLQIGTHRLHHRRGVQVVGIAYGDPAWLRAGCWSWAAVSVEGISLSQSIVIFVTLYMRDESSELVTPVVPRF